MTSPRGVADFFNAQKFVTSLGELINSLPTEHARAETIAQLETLIQFFAKLKLRIADIPTQGDVSAVRTAVHELANLFEQSRSNPVLASALGLSAGTQRPKPPGATSEDLERAKAAISQFEAMPIDQLREQLAKLSSQELKTLGSLIGVKASARTPNEALAHQIATKITNVRGYRRLREGSADHESGLNLLKE